MLEDILKDINKEFKQELAVKGIGEFVIKRIPFTSPRLNYETYGGIPRGRISMFAGKESSGKSTTALDIVKNAQIVFQQEWDEEVTMLQEKVQTDPKKIGKTELQEAKDRLNHLLKTGPQKIVYFDAEGTIDSDWARKIGVDVDNVYLVRLHYQTAEQFLDQVMKVTRDNKDNDVGLVVIDSIAVLVPQLVHGESFEKKNMGGNAKVVTDFVNEVCPVLGAKNIACIIINQARDDFNNPYAEFAIPCGNALKLASSLTLTFQKGSLLDEKGDEQKKSYDKPQGNLVWVRILKTKICKPDRRVGYYTLSYDYGVDVVADLLPLAVEYGIIKKAGSWYSVINPYTGEVLTDSNGEIVKFQGMLNLMNYIRNNEDVYNYIYSYINGEASGDTQQVDMSIDTETDIKAIQEANAPVTLEPADDIILRPVESKAIDLDSESVSIIGASND